MSQALFFWECATGRRKKKLKTVVLRCRFDRNQQAEQKGAQQHDSGAGQAGFKAAQLIDQAGQQGANSRPKAAKGAR